MPSFFRRKQPDRRVDAASEFARGRQLEAVGDLHGAASAYDVAYGARPDSQEIAAHRRELLNKLSMTEHGIVFRYIPAGRFLMGSETGDVDERPVHGVTLDRYWMAETPMSWAKYCDILNWRPPQDGPPRWPKSPKGWEIGDLKIRLQYCENETLRARGWHAHHPTATITDGKTGETVLMRDRFGGVARTGETVPWAYDQKPLVSVGWHEAQAVGEVLSNYKATYRLPTEAEWEKAARGGLVRARYPWGDEPADETRCDISRFEQFSVQPMRRYAPNSYGLYALSGGIWEWTQDWYDAAFYTDEACAVNPTGPESGTEKVLRGGSWADCPDAATVSFRMSRPIEKYHHAAPNIGFRLCRVERMNKR